MACNLTSQTNSIFCLFQIFSLQWSCPHYCYLLPFSTSCSFPAAQDRTLYQWRRSEPPRHHLPQYQGPTVLLKTWSLSCSCLTVQCVETGVGALQILMRSSIAHVTLGVWLMGTAAWILSRAALLSSR